VSLWHRVILVRRCNYNYRVVAWLYAPSPLSPASRELSPTESLGVIAFFYCLISLQKNYVFPPGKRCSQNTGNSCKKVQLQHRVIVWLNAPSNLGPPRASAPTRVWSLYRRITFFRQENGVPQTPSNSCKKVPLKLTSYIYIVCTHIVWSLYRKIFVFAFAKQVMEITWENFRKKVPLKLTSYSYIVCTFILP